jgi:N-acetylneuraminic acid mutarotase
MRAAVQGRRSPAMQKIYRRRRIVAGVLVIGIPLILVYLLLGGGGQGAKVATGHTTTTSAQGTTSTVPLQLVATDTSWHLPIPLSREVVLAVNTNLGIFGGSTTGTSSRIIYQIDPATGIANQVGTMASAVHDSAGAVIGSNYYVFGGGGATETAAVQQFAFSNATHLSSSLVGNLPAKRADVTSVTVNGQVFLVGGFDGKAWLPSVLATTDGTTFASVAQLNPAVRYPAAAALNGKLYVIGGELSPKQADATTIQQIDLQTMAVTNLSPLPVGLSHAAAVTLNGTIYVLGGRSGGHAIDTISVLNPTTGQLQTVGHLPAARSDMGVATVGQTVYLVGGEGDALKPVTTVVAVRLVPPGTAP